MRYLYCTATLMAGLLLMISACHTHDHDHDHHDHGDHAEEPDPLSYTYWSENSELFVEFPPLVIDVESRLAVHFTHMKNFKPVTAGKVTISLRQNNLDLEKDLLDQPSAPGIYNIGITPKMDGKFHLAIVIDTESFSDSFLIKDVPVYPTAAVALAAHPHQEEGDEVSFLKEQAWKLDFATEAASQKTIHEVIHTSGEFETAKGEEKIVSAKSSGIVSYKSKNLQEGRDVRSGETLFSISSKGLMQSDMEGKFQIAKARLDKTTVDFGRAENLLKDQIIGQKEYEKRKMEFTIAEAEYNTLTNNYGSSANTQSVAASMTGIVKNILVSDGEFVNEGTPLVELTSNRRLLLHAEVSQKHLPELRNLQTANFKTPYLPEVESIKNYNGKLVSYGKMLDGGSAFIPVFFELDNKGALLPGSFVELFLLTKPIQNTVVLPKSALMQDYNQHYVYIQIEGETFEKRPIELGIDDGQNIQILSGLKVGDRVVTKGAYQIKMASMATSVPAHGHAH